MQLPTTIPENDPAALWALQLQLMAMAECLLGERDKTKTLCQPSFHDHGPHIRNTPSLDGAFAELGKGSKTYWPTVVYEMAHETVHLLNPTVGSINWLEEGVAVEFSQHAQSSYALPIQQPASGQYLDALNIVRALPGGTFFAASRVRSAVGSLSAASVDQLRTLFPMLDPAGLVRLAQKCTPR